MMLKIKALGQYAIEREAVAWPPKKITSKLGIGLNFAVNVDFWVCNDDFNKKTEGKNMIFVVFFL